MFLAASKSEKVVDTDARLLKARTESVCFLWERESPSVQVEVQKNIHKSQQLAGAAEVAYLK